MDYHPLPDWLPEGNLRKNTVRARCVEWSFRENKLVWVDCWVFETRKWSDGWVAWYSVYPPDRWYGYSAWDGSKTWADALRQQTGLLPGGILE